MAGAAALVLRRRLDGRTIASLVLRTKDPYGARDTPEPVRRLAARIRFRGAGLSPEGVACVLRSRARQLEREGEGDGSTSPVLRTQGRGGYAPAMRLVRGT